MKSQVFIPCVLYTFLFVWCPVNSLEDTDQCDSDLVLHVGSQPHLSVKDVSNWENGVLNLDRSKFDTIERICEPFDDRETEEVKLDNIGLKYLKPGVFAGLNGPFSLDLSHNTLQYIEDGTFSNSDISSLDLRHNKIERIEPTAFDNMKQLKVIYLDNNQIEGWHSEWFTNSPKVQEVHISNNLLSAIPSNALRNIKGCHLVDNAKVLSSVDFSHNRITVVQEDALKDHRVFGHINLEGNSLTSISPKVFQHMDYLRNLTLNSNPMLCPSTETFESWMKIEHIQAEDTNWDEVGKECLDRQNNANFNNNQDKYEVPDDQCS